MDRIFLVRHGDTEWSRAHRHTGLTDLPLLPDGEEQARALSGPLSAYRFSQVLVSPLLRAQVYAEAASRARVAQARAERMPNLSLRAQYGFGGPATPFDSGLYSREVTGQAIVTVPIFTGGTDESISARYHARAVALVALEREACEPGEAPMTVEVARP